MSNNENELLATIGKDVSDIKVILGGNFVTGKTGVVQSVEKVMQDIYDKENGLLIRQQRIEELRRDGVFLSSLGGKIIGGVVGLSFIVCAVVAVVEAFRH